MVQRTFDRGDLAEIFCFTLRKMGAHGEFFENILGAMQQKIPIFKTEMLFAGMQNFWWTRKREESSIDIYI